MSGVPEEGRRVFRCDVRPFVAPALPQRRATTSSGDLTLAEGRLGVAGWTVPDMPVPPDLEGSAPRLRFRRDDTRSPRQLGPSMNPRDRGLAVRRVTLVPRSS